ncbi:DUF2628 domain-containing protein [Polycladidibacter stylochi]|uniref:DUF2628 domain-containing protein n=1 Tax=Polycladidibacter stylochi TaxID=1807766 RepID=UPI0008364B5F|nr:DUF2628 domain-containing protein [Pseudovibrio stylochi]
MSTYLVFKPSGLQADNLHSEDALRIAFVRDGFAWLALFFPILWFLFHRMWLVLLGYLALVVAFLYVEPTFNEGATGLVSLAFSILVAFEANALRSWTLKRKNFELAGIVSARNAAEAEIRFFDQWLAKSSHSAQEGIQPRPAPQNADTTNYSSPTESKSFSLRTSGDDVVGLPSSPMR